MMNEFDETENGQISQIARPSTIDLPKMAKITIGTFLCTPQNTIKTTTTTFFGVVRYSSASSNSLKRSNHLLLPIWSQQLSLHRRTIISIQPIDHKISIPWNLWSTPPYQSLWIYHYLRSSHGIQYSFGLLYAWGSILVFGTAYGCKDKEECNLQSHVHSSNTHLQEYYRRREASLLLQ